MDEQTKSYCRHLRTKMAHVGNAVEPDGWRGGDKTTSTYWCLRTMQTAGPDNEVACPEKCQSNRKCFVSIELTPSA